MVSVKNLTRNTIIAHNIIVADTFWARFIGLLSRSAIQENEGLLITRCNSIHMFFMRFSIDVFFVNKNNVVVGLVSNIKPFRLSPMFFEANYCIEVLPGTIARSQTQLNDQLHISPA